MTAVETIEQNVKKLSLKELAEFRDWFAGFFDSTCPPVAKSTQILQHLGSLTTVQEMLDFSKEHFVDDQERLAMRLTELCELFDEDDGDVISIDSMKSILTFLFVLSVEFRLPNVTLNENGTFQLNWRQDNFNLMTLRFKPEGLLDYVIFSPSQHIKKPVILNGCMYLFDFTEYLKDLNLYFLLEKEC